MKQFRVVLALSMVSCLAGSVQAGDVEVTPYGFILINGGYNNHIATDIPVKAAPSDTGDARGNFMLTARQSRFGLKMSSEAEGWELDGKIELDFWGLKGSVAPGGSMQAAPRMRLAYFRMTKDKVSLLFGQDWSIFAPLLPKSLAHISIVVFNSSGNLWNRVPQVRFEYKADAGTDKQVILQFAAVRPLAADRTSVTQPELLGAGEFGGLPFGQARVAFSGPKFSVGGSAHFGQEDWQTANGGSVIFGGDTLTISDEKTTTWGIAGDFNVSAGAVGFSAEGYTGSNLKMLFSNAFVRPVETSTVDVYDVEGMDVVGGWGQIAIKPTGSKVAFHGGAGIEILDEEQVEEMIDMLGGVRLYKNMTIFGNVFYSPLQAVTIALEVGIINTTYKTQSTTLAAEVGDFDEIDGENVNLNIAFKYAF